MVTARLIRRTVFGAATAMGVASCALVCVSAPAEDVLGRHAGDPVDAGFFFSEGRFVPPPYVVERRGTAILINGIFVTSGYKWPRPWETVEKDPGDPPPGVREDDGYWQRKWYFLRQRLRHEEAKSEMIKQYRRCPDVASAEPDESSTHRVVLVLHSGKRRYVPLRPNTKEYALERLEERRAAWEWNLRHSYMICLGGGGRRSFGGEFALKVVAILASDVPVEEKVTKLKELGKLSASSETWWRNLFRHLPSPEFGEHYDRVRRRELATRQARAFEEAWALLPEGVDVAMQWAVFWSIVGISR